MRSVSVRLADLMKTMIPLGFVGENEHTRVVIDSKKVFDDYPLAIPALTVKPPKGDAYPAVTIRDGDLVLWDVTDSDVAQDGYGEFQLTFTQNGVIAKSYIGKTHIEKSLLPTGEEPEPVASWIVAANTALNAIPQDIATGINSAMSNISAEAETLDAGSDATASFDSSTKVLTIGVPKGADGDPADIIDDNAGDGDTDKTWSADKLVDEFAEKYEKPSGGIPSSDMASAVQTSLGKADTAYQKPSGGIPADDIASGVIPSVTGKADKVSSAVSGNFAGLDGNGNLTDSGHKHSDYLTAHQDITGKADKVSSATNGDFAGLDSNGNLTDSGKKASDFVAGSSFYATEMPMASNDSTKVGTEIGNLKRAFHDNINNDTALKNYSLGAYDTGRNIGPMVTFVDDDNSMVFADFWPAIITAKEIPLSMAVIVGKVGTEYYGSWEDIKNYHDNYGVEILCHSWSHLTETSDYANMTVDEIAENEFARAKATLEQHGYKTDFLLYPGASSDVRKVRLAAARTFPVAVCAGGSAINTSPLSQHSIYRYSLGHNDGQTIDLATYKALVDSAVENNGWLIFMSHSQYNCMTPASAEVIKSLIDYIRSVGADIVSMRDGYARFANVVNVEDDIVRDGGFKVGADGKQKNTSGVGSGLATKQIHNFYSKISSYENLNVTEERIMTNQKLFPRTAYGILRTYRTDTNLIQWFLPYGYQEVWVRKVTGDNLPVEFTCQAVPNGTYENRNALAFERKGNAYYDETNERVIFCKTAGKRSVDQLTVTHGATASGNIKITYAFGSKDIAVEAGDTAQDVADKIAVATGFVGHNIVQCAENPLILYLTRQLAGTTSACSFTDTDSTGVTISVSRVVTGSASAWIDAAGNTL